MHISTGDTTFMMLCTAMVCLMTPGLAFFYGGLSRSKNVLLIMMESFYFNGNSYADLDLRRIWTGIWP